MILRKILIILLLVNSFFACSQTQKGYSCSERIDRLYSRQKLHLIFCSFYFEKINTFSGAGRILSTLTFYRDTSNVDLIKKKDQDIVANLKKGICNKDTGLISEMTKWCDISRKVAKIRALVAFTLEGYMELLNEFKYTNDIIRSYLKKDRTIYSLSTDEMEWIYFRSIGVIKLLRIGDQNRFFDKMRKWNFN